MQVSAPLSKAYLEENLAFILWDLYNLPGATAELELGRWSCLGLSSVPACPPQSLNRSRKVTNCGCKLALALILAYSKTLNIFPD